MTRALNNQAMIGPIATATIWILQVTIGVLFYRARVVNDWNAGDLLVFGAPFIVALTLHCWTLMALWSGGTGRRIFLAVAIAISGFGVAMLINLNLYGS